MCSSIVSIVKLHEGNVRNAVVRAIDFLGGIELPPSCNVVVKPNLCTFMGPESGATTDVRIVEALIEILNKQNPENIFVVESRSFSGTAPEKFKRLGYTRLEEKFDNVKLVNLDKDRIYEVRFPENEYLKTVKLPETILKSNYFVSVAKLKTSAQQRITCVLKNQFGCIPGGKGHHHPRLSEAIADINYVIKPDLCIIDGIYAMEGNGPLDGNPKRMDLIIVGNNPIGADTVAARVMMFNPKSVPHLKKATKRGLGSMNDIELMGENLEDVETPFKFIPSRTFAVLRLSDFIKRWAGRLQKFGEFTYLFGFFLGNVREILGELRNRSIFEIRREIRERMGGG